MEAQSERRDADHDRSAALEHVGEGQHVAAGLLGHRRARCCWRSSRILLEEDLYDKEFVRNVGELARVPRGRASRTCRRRSSAFIAALKEEYAQFTPEYAAAETGVAAEQIVEAAHAIGRAGSRFATHSWRAAAAGQPLGLADHALPLPARRPHRQHRHGRRREPARHEQVRPEASRTRRRRPSTGTSCSSRASSRSRSTR